MEKDTTQSAIMQREDELARLVLPGRRTDDGDQCTMVVLHRRGDEWHFYPHGANQLGVRLRVAEARRLAAAILAGDE